MTKEGHNLRQEKASDLERQPGRKETAPVTNSTPPTPAGAGTETEPVCPRTTAKAIRVENLYEKGFYDGAWVVDADHAFQLERELTSLRLQAEADRATINILREELDDRDVILIKLRAQLASADKDRERMRTARELLERSFRHCLQRIVDSDLNESAISGTQKLSKEIAQFLDAAMQPSASLDHGQPTNQNTK